MYVRRSSPSPAGFSLSIDDLKKFILNKEESFMKAVGGVEGLVQALQSDSQHGLPASVVSHATGRVLLWSL